METPTIYRVIVKRFARDSFNGKISIGKARFIMKFIYRVPRQEVRHVFREMEEFGLIKLNVPHDIKLL